MEKTNRPRASQELPICYAMLAALPQEDRKVMEESYSNFWGNRNKFFALHEFAFSIPVENENILWKNS
jgi:hypothetical protein